MLLAYLQNHLLLKEPFALSHEALQPGHSSYPLSTPAMRGKRAKGTHMTPDSYRSEERYQQLTGVQTCPTWVSAQPSTLPAPTGHRAVISELADDTVFLFTACLFLHPQNIILFPFLEGQIRQRNVSCAVGSLVWLRFLLLMFLIREEMAVHLRESHSVIS